MNTIALTLSFLIAIGPLASASPGQEPAVATQELPDARGLIDNYLKITGIAEKVPAIRSMRSKGKIELSGMGISGTCLLYTSPSPRDKRQSRMPSSA